jgi:hypothetical protein
LCRHSTVTNNALLVACPHCSIGWSPVFRYMTSQVMEGGGLAELGSYPCRSNSSAQDSLISFGSILSNRRTTQNSRAKSQEKKNPAPKHTTVLCSFAITSWSKSLLGASHSSSLITAQVGRSLIASDRDHTPSLQERNCIPRVGAFAQECRPTMRPKATQRGVPAGLRTYTVIYIYI